MAFRLILLPLPLRRGRQMGGMVRMVARVCGIMGELEEGWTDGRGKNMRGDTGSGPAVPGARFPLP